MQTYFNIAEIILGVVLIAVVLLQVKGQSSSLFGSAQSTYRTRRGVELVLFRFTVILGFTFAAVSMGALLLR